MKSLREIGKILKAHKQELYEKYKVTAEIGVFGSTVRGNQKKRSNIDMVLEFEEVPNLLKFINLERYLSRLLKKVDLLNEMEE
ncbi:MAG: nucleotidyltransferase domain-containing protein [Desulfobacterota bacterium]|nr:nucleotidyltransferase domain-containing protein [Thermodesulfobacteriota bacterium]